MIPKDALSISNWNVERPSLNTRKFALIKDVCSNLNSDIWFLTETDLLLEPLPDSYAIFSNEPTPQRRSNERWSAIWSRWPIVELRDYVSDQSKCVAGYVGDSKFGPLVLYATVLPWGTDPRSQEIGSFEAYSEALLLQKADWMRLRNAFPEALLVVAGDFNQSLAPRHYFGSKKKAAFLTEVLKDCKLLPLTTGVDDPVFRESYPNACIDHICVSADKGWELESTSRWPDTPTLKNAPSDHYLIKVRLTPRT